MKTRQSQATIYKNKSTAATNSHRVNDTEPQGEVRPQYRGFVLRCLAAELPRLQRAIDEFWSKAYFSAQTQAGRQAVIEQEKNGGAIQRSGFEYCSYADNRGSVRRQPAPNSNRRSSD